MTATPLDLAGLRLRELGAILADQDRRGRLDRGTASWALIQLHDLADLIATDAGPLHDAIAFGADFGRVTPAEWVAAGVIDPDDEDDDG